MTQHSIHHAYLCFFFFGDVKQFCSPFLRYAVDGIQCCDEWMSVLKLVLPRFSFGSSLQAMYSKRLLRTKLH